MILPVQDAVGCWLLRSFSFQFSPAVVLRYFIQRGKITRALFSCFHFSRQSLETALSTSFGITIQSTV